MSNTARTARRAKQNRTDRTRVTSRGPPPTEQVVNHRTQRPNSSLPLDAVQLWESPVTQLAEGHEHTSRGDTGERDVREGEPQPRRSCCCTTLLIYWFDLIDRTCGDWSGSSRGTHSTRCCALKTGCVLLLLLLVLLLSLLLSFYCETTKWELNE